MIVVRISICYNSGVEMFHTYLFAGWYYLVRGNSTVVYIDRDTGQVIASKNQDTIQGIADALNKLETRNNGRIKKQSQ